MAIASFALRSEVTAGVSGDSDSRQLEYIAVLDAVAADGDIQVLDHAEVNTPAIWDGMDRGKLDIEQIDPKRFYVTANYAREDEAAQREDPATGTRTHQFAVSLEQATIRRAKTQQRYPAETTPGIGNHGNFIDVVKGPNGLEVNGGPTFVPVQTFTIRLSAPRAFYIRTHPAVPGEQYLDVIESLQGHVCDNTVTFNGQVRQRGEVMFLGYEGTIEETGNSTISYQFGVKKNPPVPYVVEGIPIQNPVGTDIQVAGWESVWIDWEEEEDTAEKQVIAKAKSVYIYRDWDYVDFTRLLL